MTLAKVFGVLGLLMLHALRKGTADTDVIHGRYYELTLLCSC